MIKKLFIIVKINYYYLLTIIDIRELLCQRINIKISLYKKQSYEFLAILVNKNYLRRLLYLKLQNSEL